MPAPESLFWVAAVTAIIWVGLFAYCLALDRRVRRMEDEE
ncbi:MAG: CcmD family protein [Acidobacteriota bacterium]